MYIRKTIVIVKKLWQALHCFRGHELLDALGRNHIRLLKEQRQQSNMQMISRMLMVLIPLLTGLINSNLAQAMKDLLYKHLITLPKYYCFWFDTVPIRNKVQVSATKIQNLVDYLKTSDQSLMKIPMLC